MGKQVKQKKIQVQSKPVTKKIAKQVPLVQVVKGQRQYKVKPLLSHEEYQQIKTKNYNKHRKLVIKNVVLDKFQIKSAVESLKQFDQRKQTNDIFEDDGFIYLEIVLNKVPEEYSIRPVQVQLPTPIYTQQFNSKSAILVTDPQRAYKDKIQDMRIPTIGKVIGYQKLKKKYKMLKDKRSLIYTYDLFFCDWRIYNLLRKPTGKLFYLRKKIPYPIDCEGVPESKKQQFGDNYEAYLNDLNNYTYFIMGNGPVYTVKIGRTSMQVRDLVKNVIHGIYNTLPHLMSKQITSDAVRQISIKTATSPGLPVFNQLTIKEISAVSTSSSS